MTAPLKPYTAYKDSGLPWLGEVPEHWSTLPSRTVFREIKDRGVPEEPMLSVTIRRGVIPQSELLSSSSKKDSSNEDRSKYKLVCPGDIAYNKMRAWEGAIGLSMHRGIISPAYIVMRPRGQQDPRYFHYLLRTPLFTKEAERWSYGITSDQWSLRSEDFKQIYCLVPPLPEQTAIVRYLDYMNKRIGKLIRAKQKLIKLLEEQKQAIIYRAVTRGLNPNVRLKPSGVEWLGNVPEHWEVRRLKSLGTKFGSGVTPRGGATVYETTGIPLLRSQNIHFGELRLDNVALISPAIHALMSGTHVKPGDVLLNITGASIGRVCAVPEHITKANVNQHVCIIRPIRRFCDAEYLAMFLSIEPVQTAINIAQNGSSRQGLPVTEVKALSIVMPPLEEQLMIRKYLRHETQDIYDAIKRVEREITLFREYRTRLISDVATGKIDVREAAKELPDEIEDDAEVEEYDEIDSNGSPEESDHEEVDVTD